MAAIHQPAAPSASTATSQVGQARWVELACVALPVALFLAVALYHITLPGLYYDEAADAIPALDLLQGRQPELVRPSGVPMFGRTWPLMVFDYVGAVHTYAAMLFFAVLGPGVTSLRLMTILGGAATVALTYGWARWLFRSRWIGFVAAVLLAAQPSWVFYTRQGVHVSSLMSLWLMASLLLLLAWQRSGRTGWLTAAMFVLGLGLSTKILFLWVDAALLAIYCLWHAPALWQVARTEGLGAAAQFLRHRSPQLAAAGASFLLGAAPLVLYNLQTGATFDAVNKSAEVTSYGVRNGDYLTNLWARLDTVWALLHGGHFWFLGGLYANQVFPPAVAVASLALLAFWWRDAKAAGIALLLLLIVLVLLQSPFTVSGIWPTHVYILLPLLATVPAVALRRLWAWRRAGAVLAALSVGVLTAGNLYADAQYHAALVRTGGHRGHSDAVYKLAAYLDENGVPEPQAMDWGIRFTVQLLTQGRVRPVEVFGYTPEPDAGFAARLPLTIKEQRYVFHGDDYTAYPRFAAFTQAVERAGKHVHLDETFYERSGTPIYLVYSVE